MLLTREVDLLSCELDLPSQAVVARWRMGCGRLPAHVPVPPRHPPPPAGARPPRPARCAALVRPVYLSMHSRQALTSVRVRLLCRGDLDFFWRPRVELTGCTRFFYSEERGGRVVRYRETWDIGAGEALMQLVLPGRHKGPAAAAVAAEGERVAEDALR